MILEDWSQKLRQRLSSDRIVLQSGHDVEVIAADEGGDVWIVARAACVYRTLDVSGVPDNRLDKVVATQVPLLSPFREPGYWMVRQGSKVVIWIWDEAARKVLADQQPFDTEEFTIVPESCFTAGDTEGLHLYQGVVGVIAQHWSGGELVNDHWWPDMPADRDWRMFLRGIGQAYEAPTEPAQLSYGAPGRWSGVQLGALTDRFIETFLVKSISTAFIFLFAFQMTGSVRLLADSWSLENEISGVRESHQAAISNREKAFEARLSADRLFALGTVSPIHLFDRVAGALPEARPDPEPDAKHRLVLWQFENGQLEFVVKDPAPDLESYVRSLEETGSLARISVESLPRAGELKITSQVVGL